MQIDLVGVLEQGGPRELGVPQDAHQTLRIPRSTAVELNVMVIDLAGAPIDLSAASVTLRVRQHSASEENALLKTAVATSEGLARFTFAAVDTRRLDPGRYVYDVWVDDDQAIGLSPFLLEPTTRP